jgi:hypothetical protein
MADKRVVPPSAEVTSAEVIALLNRTRNMQYVIIVADENLVHSNCRDIDWAIGVMEVYRRKLLRDRARTEDEACDG